MNTQWIVTEIDGKVASIAADYRHLAKIAARVAELPPEEVGSVGTRKISTPELVEFARYLSWEDLRPFGTDCERLANVMQDVGITVNTKGIPYDDSPTARGLRAGTTVLTQRGMGPREMDEVADLWKTLATGMDNPDTVQTVREHVLDLAERFPLPFD